jgi:hypothetical protein
MFLVVDFGLFSSIWMNPAAGRGGDGGSITDEGIS